mgnify:CR=1 FL=1
MSGVEGFGFEFLLEVELDCSVCGRGYGEFEGPGFIWFGVCFFFDWGGCSRMGDTALLYVCDLENLESLSLRGLKLVSSSLKRVKKMDSLTHLDLTRCIRISDEGLFFLRGLTNLTSLSLAGCDMISGRGLQKISHLKSITELDLSFIKLKLGAESIMQFPNLQKLVLYRAYLNDENCKYFRALENLTYLDLSDTSIGGPSTESLSRIPNLEYLDIRNTLIPEIRVETLLHIPNLIFSENHFANTHNIFDYTP